MWTTVRQIFRTAPVTASIIFICSALLAWIFYLVLFEEANYRVAQEQLGVPLKFVMPGGQNGTPEVEIGLIKLWDGEWWRVIIAGLHHGGSMTSGLIHLVLNCLGLWYLGQLVEYRIGSLRMALLFTTSLVVSMLPEFLVGSAAVGMSGAICALFGYLLVLRHHDRYILEMLPDQVVRIMLIWLVACIPATYFDILPVANLAHFSGLAYGYLAARVAYAQTPWRVPARAGFLAAHLLIPIGLYAVVHPVWNAGYHWHLGTSQSLARQDRIMHLRKAVAINPQLDPAWVELSSQYFMSGNQHDAWTAILQGVHNNPSSTAAIRKAAFMGRLFQTPENRKLARRILDDVFDDEAPAWAERLMAQAPGSQRFHFTLPTDPPNKYQIGKPVNLPEPDPIEPNPLNEPLAPPDPDEADSAAVGTAT